MLLTRSSLVKRFVSDELSEGFRVRTQKGCQVPKAMPLAHGIAGIASGCRGKSPTGEAGRQDMSQVSLWAFDA